MVVANANMRRNISVSPPASDDIAMALRDIRRGLGLWHMAWTNAVAEIGRRYRRTMLGPFWATLSFTIFTVTLGVVYSAIWKMDLAQYLPYVTSGLISWALVSSIITEGASTFVAGESVIKNAAFPYTFFALTSVFRSLIVFLHHSVIYVVIAIIFEVKPTWAVLLLPFSLAYFACVGLMLTLLVAVLCSRYRDLQQVIGSVLQIVIFVTPIFWNPSLLASWRRFIFVDCNIFYHLVELIRAPLLGQAPPAMTLVAAAVFMVLLSAMTLYVFARSRRKIIFWL